MCIDETSLRARILGAMAAGWAAGCHGAEPARSVEVAVTPPLPTPATSVTPSDAPVPSDAAVTPRPSATPMLVATQAPSASPPASGAAVHSAGPCPADTKRETFCHDPGQPPGLGMTGARPSLDGRGCAIASQLVDGCSGIHLAPVGPDPKAKRCCYEVCRGPIPPCGRPLVDGTGAARIATSRARCDWRASSVDRERGAAMRAAWLADALAEHASVASFARLSLELLAVGAPPELVRAAHAAALDEIEHARLCFALAGCDAGPGPLALDGVAPRTSLAEVAAATADEGCCGETFAALLASRASEGAADPAARAALARIAADEARHAELAWRVVAWSLASDDAGVARAGGEGFARGLARLDSSRPLRERVYADAWRAAGRVPAEEHARLAQTARARVIEPARRALVGYAAA